MERILIDCRLIGVSFRLMRVREFLTSESLTLHPLTLIDYKKHEFRACACASTLGTMSYHCRPMSSPARQLATCVDQIAKFSGHNLGSKIAELEWEFGRLKGSEISQRLSQNAIGPELLEAAKTVKRASAQIDVVLHALGVLLTLPSILEQEEVVQSLSLSAGNTEQRRFDLETSRRVAEFTFIEWRGNDSMRLQKIFKDFYRLAEFDTNRVKELWVSDDSYVLKFLRGGSSIRTATQKHLGVWEEISAKYPNVQKVSDYDRLHQDGVRICVYGRQVL